MWSALRRSVLMQLTSPDPPSLIIRRVREKVSLLRPGGHKWSADYVGAISRDGFWVQARRWYHYPLRPTCFVTLRRIASGSVITFRLSVGVLEFTFFWGMMALAAWFFLGVTMSFLRAAFDNPGMPPWIGVASGLGFLLGLVGFVYLSSLLRSRDERELTRMLREVAREGAAGDWDSR